jgi:hypothetical protein
MNLLKIRNLFIAYGIIFFGIFSPSSSFSDLKIPPVSNDRNDFSCDGSLSSSATLILIDATDGLTPGQVAFVTDNFVNNLEWNQENEVITLVALHDEPLQTMYSRSFCAPKPESQIDILIDPVARIKSQNKRFIKSFISGFKDLVGEYADIKDANSTLLLEAISEVNRNARYKFNHAKSKKLILVSDLYQKSEILSFYKICKSTKTFKSRPLTCPDFVKTVDSNPRFSNYIIKAAPKMSESDSVTIYYMNVEGRVDRSAEKWWTEYFSHTGLPAGKLKIIPELQRR